MKKILLAILVLFIGSTAQSQVLQNAKRTFEAPNLNQILHSHKNIAILPIKFTQNYQRTPKGVVQEDLKNMEYNKGFGWQYAMFSFLLSQSENYFVTFQDPLRTNALLKKVNALDSLDSKLPDEISKILNVDAIIITDFVSEKSGSGATDIAKRVVMWGFGKTGSSTMTISIYDGKDGRLIFRLFKEMSKNLGSFGTEIMKRMMERTMKNMNTMKKIEIIWEFLCMKNTIV